jgi:hypothetical protein
MPFRILNNINLVRDSSDVGCYTTECHNIFRAMATMHKDTLNLGSFAVLASLCILASEPRPARLL